MKPLNVMLSYLDFLEKDKTSFSNWTSLINYAADNAQVLQKLMKNLIDIMKMNKDGEIEIIKEPVEIRVLIWKIFNIYMIQAQQNQIWYSLDFDKELPKYLICDQSKITQIVVNLIENSIKYTQNGSVKVKVQWECDQDKGSPVIEY